MTNKLSDRLREEISFWPKTASMVTTLREAMDVVKAWEDAHVVEVTAGYAGPCAAFPIDKDGDEWMSYRVSKRMKLVEVE